VTFKKNYTDVVAEVEKDIPLRLSDIVGQDEAVTQLLEFASYIKNRKIFSLWSNRPPRGILLEGGPGLGKTAAVKALCEEFSEEEMIITELSYADVESRWVGAPIENLKKFFAAVDELSKKKHVIVFIDEIDSMLPSRGLDNIQERTVERVNVFLKWMDGGFKPMENITVIGATNNIDRLDEAAKRSGRFDVKIKFKELDKASVIKGLKIYMDRKRFNSTQLGEIDWIAVEKFIGDKIVSGADLPEITDRIGRKKALEHTENLKNFLGQNLTQQLIEEYCNDPKYYPKKIDTDDLLEEIKGVGQKDKRLSKWGFSS
jgi:SpoVK/Ycf46/Vps4 family AAA+-type ATPase